MSGPVSMTSSGRGVREEGGDGRVLRWLGAMAVAYALSHHVGFGLAWMGETAERTRWADWVDVATPYAVLLTAAGALRAGGAGGRVWALFLVGAITYVEGHGVHLAANSVGNVDPGAVAHFWDEYVGHYLWYGGLVVVFAALMAGLGDRAAAWRPVPVAAAVLSGVTFTTNALEGRFAVPGLVVCAVFTWWGLSARGRLGGLAAAVAAPALVMLVIYGVWHGGFPEPSAIGWV
ncbi:hypothetical protein [Spirillospora sp. CA-294931]|uniref:hypothetical protein n=1 Tax=Spirillospora sp. CA-294931 TaxID=3240042 RepID=UPI003D9210FB